MSGQGDRADFRADSNMYTTTSRLRSTNFDWKEKSPNVEPVFEFQIIAKDPDAAGRFYCDLFGWSVNLDSATPHRRIDTGSQESIQGGIWPVPPQASNFVQLFVAVGDVASAVRKAETLGPNCSFLRPPCRKAARWR